VKRLWIAAVSRRTASKSPYIVRVRLTMASNAGRVASSRAVALVNVPSAPIRKQSSRVWCCAGSLSSGCRLAAQYRLRPCSSLDQVPFGYLASTALALAGPRQAKRAVVELVGDRACVRGAAQQYCGSNDTDCDPG
jgi:hypothetical protein